MKPCTMGAPSQLRNTEADLDRTVQRSSRSLSSVSPATFLSELQQPVRPHTLRFGYALTLIGDLPTSQGVADWERSQ